MNWYKENAALQEELRREYPAVAELIEELERQLARLKAELEQVKYDRGIKHDIAAEQIEELERQLAEKDKQLFEENLQVKRLETANLALRSERDQAVAQLHAELAEARAEVGYTTQAIRR